MFVYPCYFVYNIRKRFYSSNRKKGLFAMKKQIRNFLILTTLTTISIHFINRMINFSSSMKNLLKSDHGRFYDWKYGKIFYTKFGKGSPVLLIHDLNPASSSQEWEKISKSLSKNHTVYTIDLLGCGRSDKPNLTYTNYLYVQMITDFIKNIIQEKASLVSTGTSGSFSIMACNMDPEYFNKIILINPENLDSLARIPSKRKNTLKFLIDLPIIGTFIYNIIFSNKGIEKLFTDEYYYMDHLVSSKTLDSYYESAHLNNSNGKYLFSSICANYTNINIIHALKKVNNSIYLIFSKENEEAKEIIDAYTYYNPSIESAYVRGSKYLPQMEAPTELLQHLELFLGSM